MKVFIIASFIAACSCARLDSNYLPPASAPGAGGGPGLATPGFGRPGSGGFGGGQQSGFSGLGSPQGSFSHGGGSSQHSGFCSGAQYGGASSGSSASQSGFGGSQQSSGPQQPPIAILSYENVNNGDGSYKFFYETENGNKAQEQGELKNKGSENAIQTVSGSYSYTGGATGQLITVTHIADENGFQPQGDHLPTPPPIPKEIAESLKVIAAAQAQGNQGYQGGNNNYNGQQSNNNGYPSAPSHNDYPSAPVNQGYPSAPASFPAVPASVGRPGNQYVPPANQPRPTGNGGFNTQSGYKY